MGVTRITILTAESFNAHCPRSLTERQITGPFVFRRCARRAVVAQLEGFKSLSIISCAWPDSLLTNKHVYTILFGLCVATFARQPDAGMHVLGSCARALGAHVSQAGTLSRLRKNAGLSEGNHGFGKPQNRRGKSEGKVRAEKCCFFRGFRANTLPAIPRGSVFRPCDSPQTPIFPREMAFFAIPVVRDGKVRERCGD
jgi:hypothetical protein